jgi:peptidoglycan/xylan/chitin deacetylase (PgdA/CDA1 family)
LLVESRPAGAVIFVNGRNMGTTPATLDALAPGGYEITLERDGYRSWSTIVRVTAGERTRVAASLAAEDTGR